MTLAYQIPPIQSLKLLHQQLNGPYGAQFLGVSGGAITGNLSVSGTLTVAGVSVNDAAIITTGSVPVAHGGTGATTAAGARTNLGLGTLAVQNASAPVFTGTVANTSVPGTTYSYDVSSPGVVLAASGKADFHSFSGLVLVTNSGNGSTALFLCGGGAVLVSNVGSSPGSMAGNSGINGYSYTAAVAGTYFFFVIRTRPAE